MALFYLSLAILMEIIGTISLKQSASTGNHMFSLATGLSYAASFTAMWFCLKTMPLSLAYATWCGVGIALATLAGLFLFNEKIDLTGYLGIGLIIIGIVLLFGFSTLGGQSG